MIQNLGYDKPLFILAFDHRNTFKKANFQDKEIVAQKWIIYEAFKKAVSEGVSKDYAAILIDEEFGDLILKDAKKTGFNTLLTTEKSGEKKFDFEYKDFGSHIEKYKPTFAKALVRFDPDNPSEKSIENLRILSDWCHNENFRLLIEILVPDSESSLIIETISQFQKDGIEPDVWKIQGQENELDYQAIVEQAKVDWRENVGVVILGAGEDKEKVKNWIVNSSKVNGISGFAIGRTIFWQPLIDFRDGKIKKEEAISKISENYKYFYNLFNS